MRGPVTSAILSMDARSSAPRYRPNAITVVPAVMLWVSAFGLAHSALAQTADADAPPRPIHLNLRQFEIPFSLDTSGGRPSEVQLYVSRDAGEHWQLAATQPPTVNHFRFEANQDGDHWFATRTVDARGNRHPSGPIRPQLAVRVDTVDPQAELRANIRDSGEVKIVLEVVDDAPNLEAVQLHYTLDQSNQWLPIEGLQPATSTAQESAARIEASVHPSPPWYVITLRALVADQAGNRTVVTRQFDRPRVASLPMQLAGSRPPQSRANPFVAASTSQRQADHQAGTAAPNYPNYSSYPQQSWAVGQYSPANGILASGPSLTGPDGRGIDDEGDTPQGGDRPATQTPRPAPPDDEVEAAPRRPRPKTPAEAMRPLSAEQLEAQQSIASQRHRIDRPAASSSPTERQHAETSLSQTSPAEQPGGEAPPPSEEALASVPMRHSASRRFSLEYEVESAGLSGVADVELWGTIDRGATWKRWGIDPDRRSPFDIETNNDGVYGFRIVVVATNGLATPRPLDGESPDIFVTVDTIAPQVRITGAAYGELDQTGSLIIRYRCQDDHLGKRPIALSFGPSPQGPWTTIAAGLENQGVYAWPADPHLPRQIYLRIDATDLAGNRSHDVLDAPIDTRGLAPRARIRGFNPLTGKPPEDTANDREKAAGRPAARFR